MIIKLLFVLLLLCGCSHQLSNQQNDDVIETQSQVTSATSIEDQTQYLPENQINNIQSSDTDSLVIDGSIDTFIPSTITYYEDSYYFVVGNKLFKCNENTKSVNEVNIIGNVTSVLAHNDSLYVTDMNNLYELNGETYASVPYKHPILYTDYDNKLILHQDNKFCVLDSELHCSNNELDIGYADEARIKIIDSNIIFDTACSENQKKYVMFNINSNEEVLVDSDVYWLDVYTNNITTSMLNEKYSIDAYKYIPLSNGYIAFSENEAFIILNNSIKKTVSIPHGYIRYKEQFNNNKLYYLAENVFDYQLYAFDLESQSISMVSNIKTSYMYGLTNFLIHDNTALVVSYDDYELIDLD